MTIRDARRHGLHRRARRELAAEHSRVSLVVCLCTGGRISSCISDPLILELIRPPVCGVVWRMLAMACFVQTSKLSPRCLDSRIMQGKTRVFVRVRTPQRPDVRQERAVDESRALHVDERASNPPRSRCDATPRRPRQAQGADGEARQGAHGHAADDPQTKARVWR